MVGTNLKAETSSLMDKRSGIEAEMNLIIHRLTQPGAPGFTGNLLDSEGFPRSDIDIPMVRADRLRLSVLRNDYQNITDRISENVQVLHSARLALKSSAPKDSGKIEGSDNPDMHTVASSVSSALSTIPSGDALSAMDVDAMASIPFAMVDEISEASPAAEDGLQLGDQIVKFGSVISGDNLLQKLSFEAQSNQGSAVPVLVMRQGIPINLTVTPRAWQGRGLLGCHFRIL